MKNAVILSALMLTSLAGQPVFAQEAAVVEEPKVEAVAVGNKICPVSKEEVGKMGDVVTVEHNGKIYNLCCSMCVKDFKADPEKFAKIAEDEVAAAKEEGK